MSTDNIKLLGKVMDDFTVMSLVALKKTGFAYKVRIRCGRCGNEVEHTRYPEGVLAHDSDYFGSSVNYWLGYIQELRCPYCNNKGI